MDTQEQSIIDRIRQANSVLVTVSANPSVDQLAACVGLTIMLNAMDKRATAVFSGAVPSTLEFLQPEETIEKNTDSLQDFIIALDKSKADKLRYKVEDQVVRIFITPYRTSISDQDLEFSKGDFNVDVVVCLGVQDQKDLDQAILAHGRILHDATVVSVNTAAQSNIGTLNWQNPQASSLSEMVVDLAAGFNAKLDAQIATALLTGVVAETNRFSNEKTTPQTMQISAQLMAAGANQQLVATKLEMQAQPQPQQRAAAPQPEETVTQPPTARTSSDGTLSIAHAKDEPRPKPQEREEVELPKPEPAPGPMPEPEPKVEEKPEEPEPQRELAPEPKLEPEFNEPAPESESQPEPQPKKEEVKLPPVQAPREVMSLPPPEAVEKEEELPAPIHINTEPEAHVENQDRDFLAGNGLADNTDTAMTAEDFERPSGAPNKTPSFVLTPPTLGGTLTANSRPEGLDPSTDPFSQGAPTTPQILTHNASGPADNTMHDQPVVAPPDEGNARNAVDNALAYGPVTGLPKPRADLSAVNPFDDALHAPSPAMPLPPTEPMTTLAEPMGNEPAPAAESPSAQPLDMPMPAAPTGPIAPPIEPLTQAAMPAPAAPSNPPPPVPPPFMPQPIQPNGQ